MSSLRAHAPLLAALALAACSPRHNAPGPIEHELGISTAPAPDPVTSDIAHPDAGNEIVASRPLSRAATGGGTTTAPANGTATINGRAPAPAAPAPATTAAPATPAPTTTAPPAPAPAPAEPPPTGVLTPPPPSNP